MQANETLVRRQVLTLESLRALVNIELSVRTECHGVQIRRIVAGLPLDDCRLALGDGRSHG